MISSTFWDELLDSVTSENTNMLEAIQEDVSVLEMGDETKEQVIARLEQCLPDELLEI